MITYLAIQALLKRSYMGNFSRQFVSKSSVKQPRHS